MAASCQPIDRAAFPPLAAVGALDVVANAMFATALTLGMAASVSVLGSLYPLATVVLARAVLGERVTGRSAPASPPHSQGSGS